MRDGIVAFEFADAFGDGLVRQLREDFLADMVVHLGQRGEIELRAHHLDELGAQLRFERDEQAGRGRLRAGARPARAAKAVSPASMAAVTSRRKCGSIAPFSS